ncbi:MAG: hypothetical protein J2P36_30805, partial [Ktedonobacteraceae bacterium]|nr:hypothetical protein [Ktedonobacteraceae bacterium]
MRAALMVCLSNLHKIFTVAAVPKKQYHHDKEVGNVFMYIPENFSPKNWQDFEPHYQALLHETLTQANLSEWLHRGSELEKYVWEIRAGYKRARSRNIE